MRQRVTHTSLIVGILLLLLTPTVFAAESGTIGGKPANPRSDNARSESIFVHELKPGESIDDAVLVINNSNKLQEVYVYATDARVASGGSFTCEQKADKIDKTGTWITISKSSVLLGANKSEIVPFKISVPKDALAGESNACIVMQPNITSQNTDANGVQLSFRSAIRVAVTVPGDIQKELIIDKPVVNQEKSKLLVIQNLQNNGNVSLDTDISIKLKGIIGRTIEEKNGTYPVIAKQSAEFNFEFKRPILGGIYNVVSQAKYDDSLNTTLGKKGSSQKIITSNAVIFIWPHPVAMLIMLSIVALVFIYARRKMQKRNEYRTLHTKAIDHKVKKGQDLTIIAEKYNADWKQMVALNKLKPPYALKKGDVIKIVPGEEYNPPVKKTKSVKTKSSKKPKATKKVTTKKQLKSNQTEQ